MQTRFGEDTFVVIETWMDSAALKSHFSTPHRLAYRYKPKDMVATRAVHVLATRSLALN